MTRVDARMARAHVKPTFIAPVLAALACSSAAVVARCDGFDPAHPILVELQRRVAARLASAIGLTVALTLVAPRTVPRSEGKAVRVVEKG